MTNESLKLKLVNYKWFFFFTRKLKKHCIHRNEVEGDGRREHLKIR